MMRHLLNQRSGWENGDKAWLVLRPSGRGTAFPAFTHNALHTRRALRDGVRAISHSKSTSPQQVTAHIKKCKDLRGLKQLLLQHGTNFNHIHVSAAWSTFKKIQREGDKVTEVELIRLLQELTESQMQGMGGREVANILHAIAKVKAADTSSI